MGASLRVRGFWFVVSGFWFVVSGLWFRVCGFGFVVSGCWNIRDWRPETNKLETRNHLQRRIESAVYRGPSAVHKQHRSGYVTRRVGGQINNRPNHLVRARPSAERALRRISRVPFGVIL